jgi:hypothetical protein
MERTAFQLSSSSLQVRRAVDIVPCGGLGLAERPTPTTDRTGRTCCSSARPARSIVGEQLLLYIVYAKVFSAFVVSITSLLGTFIRGIATERTSYAKMCHCSDWRGRSDARKIR